MRVLLGSRKKSWGMSQKLLCLMLILVLSTAVGCSNSSNESGQEQKQAPVIELRLAHFFPSTHPAETELIQPWIAAIEEATAGQVKIVSYPNQTLLNADSIYAGVVDGSADLGLSCFSYTRGRFPVLEVFELPGITYNNSKVASKVAWEGIQELNPQEIQDTKLMMVLTTGPGDLYTKSAVRSLDDIKGMEIRATGLSATTLQALGAVPAAMPQSDAYEALTKGVVKGNLGPIEVLKGWKQAEVTSYITQTPFLYNTLFFVTMNLDKWNSLEPDVQQAIEAINEEYFEKVAISLWDKQNEDALKYAVDEQGMEVITLTPEEADKWISLVQPIQDDFVARMNADGKPGQEILDTVKQLADKYNAEFK
jgi:TRAP-type C4-dicarboxylate transport system substrate-binding protein